MVDCRDVPSYGNSRKISSPWTERVVATTLTDPAGETTPPTCAPHTRLDEAADSGGKFSVSVAAQWAKLS
jgi:hypothetical protein